MLDALKNYLNLASGYTEVTRQRAVAAAKALQASGEATAEQVQNLADELLVNSRNNRDALLALVRYEVDRALNRLGLATADEVASLQRRVTSLEGALAQSPNERAAKATKASGRTAAKAPAKAAAKSATKTAAKATKSAARTAARTASSTAPARSTAAKSTAAKSTAAKSTAAKSTAAKATSSPAKSTAATATKTTAAKSPAKATAAKSTAAKASPAKKAAGAGPSTS